VVRWTKMRPGSHKNVTSSGLVSLAGLPGNPCSPSCIHGKLATVKARDDALTFTQYLGLWLAGRWVLTVCARAFTSTI